ncbi:RHS repeat domain-containing protein [Bergeyella zoohelcum]|uniref:RHS repeat-associated core domain n=1 Tax=Bergeyella zoohelcum TaxID=1015 RepID=A0A376C0I9_9FLAO|nr:RHS repeat-associated core domain-containing protein [Bergeyella zoohelcum]SSZ47244.1 RHS repeat-associated core domain [Bergeyella zoohelcum]
MQYGNSPIEIGRLQPTAYSLLLDRGYTSHEHLFEVGLIHMNGRLYDPLLIRFLNADEHIQDPYNTQNYNKYGYVYNNPLMYNDPSGEFAFLVPILTKVLIGAIYGAIVGAGVGAIAYTIKGLVTKEWSWSNFGKAILGGAIAGAISGGFNSLFRGGNIWDGVKAGFKNGMYNGAAQSAFMIGTFGATYKLSEKRLEYVKKMSKKYNVDYSNVKWRKGGLYQVLQPLWSNGNKRDVVWGNNVVNFNNSEQNVLGHEFGHIIQGRNQGWSNFQARGIWEQLFFS